MRFSLTYPFFHLFYKPFLRWYLARDRKTRFRGFHINVRKGVFHPRFFFSSAILCEFVGSLDLHHKTFLEIGCGSGVVSMEACRKGATVTAVDINPEAVLTTRENFAANFTGLQNVEVVVSDLFENIRARRFDFIVVNPPYYFRKPENPAALAWNCGESGEFFEKLFANLPGALTPGGQCFMMISDAAELSRIRAIAEHHNVTIVERQRRKVRWEVNFIWQLIPVEPENKFAASV